MLPIGIPTLTKAYSVPLPLLTLSQSWGNVALPEVYDWIAESSPEHPLFVYHDNVEDALHTITWREANRGFNRAAHYFAKWVDPQDKQAAAAPPVVALLASSDSITYFSSIVGILRAGFTAFLVSPRNGPDALAYLLRTTQSRVLFTSVEFGVQALAEKALAILSSSTKEGPLIIPNHPMPTFEDLYSLQGGASLDIFPKRKHDLDAPACILHSSGTTAFPKPITWSHHAMVQSCRTPYYGEIDFTGLTLGCHGLPVYHAMGLLLLSFASSSGAIVSVFRPQSPAVVATPDNVFEGAIKKKNDILCAVPSLLEDWAKDPEKVAFLKTLKGTLYGGGPLSQTVGDYLAAAGVTVFQCYGLTETGGLNLFLPHEVGKHWDYIRPNPQANVEFVSREEGKFELVTFANEQWAPMVVNTELNGRPAYATSDLFIPHPTKPGYWKIFARTDEQIMLSTGEKTNPVPLEKILLEDPHVQGAIMFGRGRPHNGVLIEPKAGYNFDSRDHTKLAQFRNLIWPTVERMNDYAPQHSRLFKEMIVITSSSKPFSYTAKGSTRRGTVLSDYEEEINACYDEVEKSANIDTTALDNLEPESIRGFIRQVVTDVMDKEVADDVDIFQCGCDSLQATWIRNKILMAVKTHDLNASRKLSPNFVYQAPTIVGLTQLVLNVLKAPANGDADPTAARIRELQDAVKRLTQSFPARPTNLRERSEAGDVILLTGTSGGLGCNMLAHMTKDPTVRKVYAFNRPSDRAVERQVDAFVKQGVLADSLRRPKYQLVEGDLSKPFFGLDAALYEEIRDSVTHIIHNAWPVDFNLNLVSFEKHLQGTRNLVDFALSSPFVEAPRVMFISSIGMFRHPKSRGIAPEELVDDPSVPIGQGYAESKWVGEHILAEATKHTGLPTVSVRVGQLSGNRVGYWNEREWFPSLVKSGVFVGCLPDVPGVGPVSWLPLHNAGEATAQMRHSPYPTLHLVNPKLNPWRTFLEPIANELGVPLVPYNTWLSKLEDSLKDPSLSEVEHLKRNPALRLLEMFKHADLSEDIEPPGLIRLATVKSTEVAPSLNHADMSRETAKGWVVAWRASGFLPATA
ncbi:unnamed protein product [Somion occarium]|uniref:Acetyl-CoA synthetase-like protein n=1 Tax=Somion occarium TaxID=3059160 RepID=A0ABP1DPW6_9APHY